jgi:hypothetical protein
MEFAYAFTFVIGIIIVPEITCVAAYARDAHDPCSRATHAAAPTAAHFAP